MYKIRIKLWRKNKKRFDGQFDEPHLDIYSWTISNLFSYSQRKYVYACKYVRKEWSIILQNRFCHVFNVLMCKLFLTK